MLETPGYPALLGRKTSDKASGADNQQERPGQSLRNPQRPYAELPMPFGWDEDMVHPLWRHRDKVNYNGPKVRNREPSLSVMAGHASGYMLGTLANPSVLE